MRAHRGAMQLMQPWPMWSAHATVESMQVWGRSDDNHDDDDRDDDVDDDDDDDDDDDYPTQRSGVCINQCQYEAMCRIIRDRMWMGAGLAMPCQQITERREKIIPRERGR